MTYTIQKDTMDMECCSRDFEAECPVRATVRLLGGKYKSVVIWSLRNGKKRFSEIQAMIPEATGKMLTKQLRELEADGLIERKVYPVVPPKTEYSLTEFGETAIPLIMDMSRCVSGMTFDGYLLGRTLQVIGGKYKMYIIWRLMDGPKRFGELRTFFSGITAHILSLQLKELESDGLIRREVKSENPPWVEYSLTSTGMSLLPVIDTIAEWGAAYIDMENEKAKLSGSSRSPE